MERKKGEIIEEINKLKLYKLEDIDCGSALQLPLNNMNCTSLKLIRLCIDEIISLFKQYDYTLKGKGNIVFLYLGNNLNNPHIFRLMQRVANLLEEKYELVVKKEKRWNKYIYLLYLFPFWTLELLKVRLGLLRSMYLSLELLDAYMEVRGIQDKLNQVNFKGIASIHDVRLEDSLLIQIYNKKNIETIALAHGSFRLPEDLYDYRCSRSKYYVVVDEKMYSEASKSRVYTGELIRACLPQYIGLQPKKVLFKIERNIFGVFLNHPSDKENNHMLLECAEKLAHDLKIKYYIKIHPSDEIKEYRKYEQRLNCLGICERESKIESILEKVDFVIVGYRSKSFLDSIFYGKLAFRGMIGEEKDFYTDIEALKFNNYEELYLELTRCLNSTYVLEIMKNIITRYISEEYSKEGYKNLFFRIS